MNTCPQIAKHLREVHFGGNWCCVNLKETMAGVTWQQSITQVHNFNTIATLVFHMNYYVCAVTNVLQGKPLNSKDEYSFSHPPINSPEDWEKLLQKTWADAETLAGLIEQLPEARLWEIFAEEKYGMYYRHLHGVIEHCHYHLGQIVLIKKLVQQTAEF